MINSIEAANDPGVFETLMNAEALFIAGGDQSQYLKFWEGTKVEEAIKQLITDKLIPIGGTSAGCAIMGEYVYTGENGSIVSDETLQNPFDQKLTVRKSTLINHPFLKNTITDQHFSQRDRAGRLVGFLARLKEFSGANPLRAIAVDEKTALVIDKDGKAQVLGQSDAYFLIESDAEQAPEQIQTQLPLTWDLGNKALKVAVVSGGDDTSIDIKKWDLDWKGYWYAIDGKLITN